MDQISQYLLLGFEGDLFITLGLGSGTTTTDACSMWPRGMWPDGMWPDTCPVADTGAGGRNLGQSKETPRVIRLADLRPGERQSTADFLKARLGLLDEQQPKPVSQPVAKRAPLRSKADIEAQRVADEALRNMEIERENEIRILRNNNMIIAMIMMANG